ncbi:NUDIX hydrolase [Pseudonocardia endophytica]|uniref:NUDIX domain-containing protein n=1 Tax=Pseudonocardia endophytica TaxID=401976 RepID=A0A4R1HI90_PSEEN|nr:CoA pyrophosphatase [Pseudonocardia endophytica]TCK21508.1 NUDIX domain-containing protein [Pseudonocardia endophytica]
MTEGVLRWLSAEFAPAPVPDGWAGAVRALGALRPSDISHNDLAALEPSPRQAAVLVLLADDGPDGPDVLLQRRSGGLRSHAGEVSFPGGRREDADHGPVDTALREAAEETGLDPSGVDPLVLLPRLVLGTGYHVTGVVAYWRTPVPVTAVDHDETAEVFRMPLARLADPAVRLAVHHPMGWSGPAFDVEGMVIWGYTSEVLGAVLRAGGWERPWTPGESVELDRAWERARRR